MGKPVQGHAWTSLAEFIGEEKQTRGTETSKYPEEEKSTETLRVAASERGIAQTGGKKFLPGSWDSVMGLGGVAEGDAKAPPERVIAPYAKPRRALGESRVPRGT